MGLLLGLMGDLVRSRLVDELSRKWERDVAELLGVRGVIRGH